MKKLLVVEDDVVQQRSIADLLQGEDVDVVVVTSGKEALEQLESGGLDSVVLDLLLPNEDGARVLENIKTNPEVEVEVANKGGTEKFQARAQVIDSRPECDRLFKEMCKIWPSYADYQTRTERVIPVVILERES